MRRAAGPGPIVGLRPAVTSMPWGGLKPEDSRDLALRLCSGGLVDYVAVEVAASTACISPPPPCATPKIMQRLRPG